MHALGQHALALESRFPHSPHVIRFAVLGSGSSGNSAVVECGDFKLMIDAGLSAKQLCLRLAQLGIEPTSLDGILLTHEHGDHIRGLKVFLKKHQVPVLATPQTAHIVRQSGITDCQWKTFETGQSFSLGGAEIRSFSIQHDAVDPVGFVIGHQTRKLGFVSDAGFVTHSMTESLRDLHALFIEANYDDDLLESDTKRPWSIKQRISSRHGHLSNRQVGTLVEEIAHAELNQLILGHLSSDCNHPDLATSHLRECLQRSGHAHIRVNCATPDAPSGWFTV